MSIKLRRVLLICGIVSVAGIIIIRYIRGIDLELSPAAIFLRGTLPNFFGVVIISGAVFSFMSQKGLFGTFRRRLTFTMIFTFAGLTLWEYIQCLMGYPVDYYDILMSFIGCVLMTGIILCFKKKGSM